MENTYFKYHKDTKKSLNIKFISDWWKKQSLRGELKDKGGSFNIELYLDYLSVINEQPSAGK